MSESTEELRKWVQQKVAESSDDVVKVMLDIVAASRLPDDVDRVVIIKIPEQGEWSSAVFVQVPDTSLQAVMLKYDQPTARRSRKSKITPVE